MTMSFVNLHHHSTFSFGDGFGTPAQHVARAAELGYTAIALTEHGGVSSHFQLERAALAHGIKPIFGLEAYCGSVDPETRGQFKNHLTILAGDEGGYRSLNRIVTESYQNFHYHPTVSGASLAANADGLYILSGCSGSLLACTLLGGKGIPEPESPDGLDWDGARRVIEQFQSFFGDRYFIEVQPFPEIDRTISMNTAYEKLSEMTGARIVVTCDVHYPDYKDRKMQAVLHAVHRGKATVDDQLREWNYDVPLTLPRDEAKLAARLELTGLSRSAAVASVSTAAEVAAMCNVTLPKAARLRYPVQQSDLEPWS